VGHAQLPTGRQRPAQHSMAASASQGAVTRPWGAQRVVEWASAGPWMQGH
jgi:hypothetical protein